MNIYSNRAIRKGQMSDEEPCTPEEDEAMASYLQGNAPALETAKIIMSVDEKHEPLERFNKLNRVPYLIFDASIDFPDKQTHLLDLLNAIRGLRETDQTLLQISVDVVQTGKSGRSLTVSTIDSAK